jgi:sigma-B regulation protein RsbU (phosphoserine phosphatase)
VSDDVPFQVFDPARLAAVRATALLDTAPDDAFDRLAALAAELLAAPFAFVTLVDDRRSFWKAAIGLPAGAARGSAIEDSFCQYVISEPGVLLIDDAAAHSLTCENPAIERMGVAAWAGATLLGPGGEALGSFCVVDTRRRQWTAQDAEVLRSLAEAASAVVARKRP